MLALILSRVWAADTPADWKLPPLDGELSGEFDAVILGGAPKVKWKATIRTEKPRERVIVFSLEGHGLRLQGGARVNPMGDGDWRIAEAEFQLGDWFGWLAPRLAPDAGSVSATGLLRLNGKGTWRAGALGGQAGISLREGRIEDITRAIRLEGISVDVEIADIAARRTQPAQVFTWRSGSYSTIPLGVGRIEFMLEGEKIRINNAAFDIFGGELRVGSLEMSTARPEFSVDAEMIGVAIDRILFLLPPVLSEAKGRLDGHLALKRDATGVQIGDGRLTLRKGETADLRLAVKPGWLSTSLPPDIVKYFPAFRQIETGEIPIRARQLELTLTPLGDEQGRTAWVHIAGGPSDPAMTAPIDTNINVRGPLEALVKIGAEVGRTSRLRFGDAR